MTRFVNLYLLVSGGLAGLALAIPSLVVMGLFLLILPGLILGLAPTAFMWGLGFALPWYAVRPVLGDYLAIVPAALIAAAIFWFIPQAGIAESKARLSASLQPELIPAQPIRLAGHILLSSSGMATEKGARGAPYDQAEIARRPYVCDAVCAALLATPGVESVTVNSDQRPGDGGAQMSAHARTFRLVPKSECSGPSVRPTNPDQLGLTQGAGGASRARIRRLLSRPLQAEWDVRLSTKECIVAEAPRTQHDFVIRKHSYRNFESESPRESRWSLGALPVSVDMLEIAQADGRILLRKMLARTSMLQAPLNIGTAGDLQSFHFKWSRKDLSNGKRYESFNANQLLADHSTLRTEVDFATVMQDSRDRLAHALADPALPASDPAFQLAGPWMNSLDGQEVSDADRALVATLIRDPRVTKFDGLHYAIKAMGESAAELRAPMIERIASTDLTASDRPRDIGRVIASLPPGTFASLTDPEKAILADPARRVLAAGLISRQADRGPAAVPLLLDILKYHLREIARERAESAGASDNMIPVDRVRMALCLMGPEAASALPAIERLAAEGLVDQRFADSREWQLMLARLGKPVTSIPKPGNLSGTEANFHRNLQERLDRFKPDRCGPQWS
ncbi:MAG TPA: hypothetical protein VIL42_07105 [Sphingomicrobium sp.]